MMPQSWKEFRRVGCGSFSVMRSRLGWTSLSNQRRMIRAAYIRRCMQGLRHGYMRNMLKTREDMGVRILDWTFEGHLKDIYLPSHRTSWLEKSFILCAGKDWNRIPVAIREASHYTFETSLRLLHGLIHFYRTFVYLFLSYS